MNKLYHGRLLLPVFFFLSILSIKGQTTTTIDIQNPVANGRYADNLSIAATITSAYVMDTVRASVSDRTVLLVQTGGVYRGTLSLAGLSQGPLVLQIYTRDVLGNIATKDQPFIFDTPPVVNLESPVAYTTYQTKIRIKASVSDVGSTNVKGVVNTVYTTTQAINFINSIDTLINIVPNLQSYAFGIKVTATDSANQSTAVTVPVFTEKSTAVNRVFEASGEIMDFRGQRALMRYFANKVPYFKIVSTVDTSTIAIPMNGMTPPMSEYAEVFGVLCDSGAAFIMTPNTTVTENYRLLIWRNDTLIDITQSLGTWARLRRYDFPGSVKSDGKHVVWLTWNGELAITEVATMHTTIASGRGADWFELSRQGKVAYTLAKNVYTYDIASGATQQITNMWENFVPLIDGELVAYRALFNGSRDSLVLFDGMSNKLLFPLQGSFGGVATWRVYDSAIAYGRNIVRIPAYDTLKILPIYSAGASVEILGNDASGLAVLSASGATGGRYYFDPLNLNGYRVSGALGKTYYQDTAFYLALGGSLFRYNIVTGLYPPQLYTVTPDSAAAGETITIKGKYLTGVNMVSLGGVPVAGFTVPPMSDTVITATVGTGATGDIIVSTQSGVDTLKNAFTFVLPPPAISAITPVQAKAGTTVTITGTNFTDATAVRFGGISAASFTVNSGTEIVAVVADGASGMVEVTTPLGTANWDGFVFQYSLQPDNFTISSNGLSCRGTADGGISITADENLAYTATVTGSSFDTTFNFSTTADVGNLAAGSYEVCITVAGQPDYNQCFTTVVGQPEDLSVFIAFSPQQQQVILNMTGAAYYNITLNDSTIRTSSSSVTLALRNGINRLAVSTDKSCQGIITKELEANAGKLVYPNPFRQTFTLHMGNTPAKQAVVTVFDMQGKIVWSRQYKNQSGPVPIDLSNTPGGLYIVKLLTDDQETSFKILKN